MSSAVAVLRGLAGIANGLIALGAIAALRSGVWRTVRPARYERTRRLPGDEFIVKATRTITHGITINGSPGDIWPWLAQMGAGSRAGWYSYDFLDNGRHPSATRIVPELQAVQVGAVFPAMPGVTEGFRVLALEPDRYLVLGWPDSTGRPLVSWAFVLERDAERSTRLLVRVRAVESYRFHRLPSWLSDRVIRAVHFIMERRQLLQIAKRVERRISRTMSSRTASAER